MSTLTSPAGPLAEPSRDLAGVPTEELQRQLRAAVEQHDNPTLHAIRDELTRRALPHSSPVDRRVADAPAG